MTLSSQDSRVQYNGDGAQTTFPVTFPYLQNGDIAATLRDAAGVETTWVESTNYSLTGGAGGPGTLTATVAPASGETLTIRRIVQLVQEVSYPESGAFPAQTHELALDYSRMVDQQQQEEIDRSIKLSVGDPVTGLELADVATRGSKLLGFTAGGALQYVSGVDSSSDLVIATGSTTARTLSERFAETFNVKDFGAKGDNSTDDTVAIQAALTAAATYGGTVYIPAGRYLVSAQFNVGDMTTVQGDGMGHSIVVQNADGFIPFHDGGSLGREFAAFKDFTVYGRWETTQSQGGDSERHFRINNYDHLHFERVESLFCRQMGITGWANEGLVVKECRILYCARDAINFSGSRGVAHFINNTIRHCHDDAIAYHTTSVSPDPAKEGIVVTGNHLEDTFGIKILGARKMVMNHNVCRRCKGYALYIGRDGIEGRNDQLAIDISNNIITDVFNATIVGGGNVQVGIYLDGVEPSNGGGATAVPPGQFDHTADVWIKENDHWLDTIGDPATVPHSGSWFVNVSNNIITQTLDDATNYSDYGFGAPASLDRLFDPDGWADPAITGHILSGAGITVAAAIDQLHIHHNKIYGVERGIRYQNADRIHRHTIENNIFVRLGSQAISQTEEAITYDMQMRILNNYCDLDPLLENSDRTTGPVDGTWKGLTVFVHFVDLVNWKGVLVAGNHLRNMERVYHSSGTDATVRDNWLYGEFVGPFSASNKGIRQTQDHAAQHFVFVDSDPQSATYDAVINYPHYSAGAQPSSGSWFIGTIVRNDNPTVDGNGNILYGWFRLTTGSGNVAATDWETIYWKTNSP